MLKVIEDTNKMIQNARSSKSQSFLREAETLQLLINDENIKKFFKEKLKSVIEKRRDPEITLTGAKALRDDLLAYLEQRGEVKTANLWARKIKFLKADELLANIRKVLSENGIEGVVELHLQDREINSPHIQFVGNNVEYAEELIANEILKMGFEDNFDSCVSRKSAPAYYEDKSIRVIKYDDRKREIEEDEKATKLYNERKEQFKDYLKSLEEKRNNFLNIVGIKKDKTLQKLDNIRSNYPKRRDKILSNTIEQMLKEFQNRILHKKRYKGK